jgi:hypothetical protein
MYLDSISYPPAPSEPVTGGVFLVPPGNPDAGAVYCIGGGTQTVTPSSNDDLRLDLTLTNLSRLGTCADQPVDDTLTGHVNGH